MDVIFDKSVGLAEESLGTVQRKALFLKSRLPKPIVVDLKKMF